MTEKWTDWTGAAPSLTDEFPYLKDIGSGVIRNRTATIQQLADTIAATPVLPGLGAVVVSDAAPSSMKSAAAVASNGYLCDGTSDAAEINTAYSTWGHVTLIGPTFNLGNTALTARHVEGPGSLICTLTHGTSNEFAFDIGGSRSSALGTTPVSAAIAKGALTITCDENLTGSISAGDWINIRSTTEQYNSERSYYLKGEIHRVKAITATKITLESPTLDSYSTAANVRIYKYTFSPVHLEGFTVAHGGGTMRQTAIKLSYSHSPVVRDVHCEGLGYQRGILLTDTVNAHLDDVRATNVADQNKGANPALGYGIHAFGNLHCYITDFYGDTCRHAIDVNGGYDDAYVVGRFTFITRAIAANCTAAGLASHGNCEYTWWTDCAAYGCGGGFFVRGGQNKITNPVVIGHVRRVGPKVIDSGTATGGTATTLVDSGAGWSTDQFNGTDKDHRIRITGGTGVTDIWTAITDTTSTTITVGSWPAGTPDATSTYEIRWALEANDSGIKVGEENTEGGTAGEGLTIINPRIDQTGAFTDTSSSQPTTYGIRIHDPLVDAYIGDGGMIVGHTDAGLQVDCDNITNTVIGPLTIDQRDSFSARVACDFDNNATDGDNQVDLVLDRVVVYRPRAAAFNFQGNVDSSPASDRIELNGCRVPSLGSGASSSTAMVVLAAGYFGTVLIDGGWWPATAEASISDVSGAGGVTSLVKRGNFYASGDVD